MKLKEKIVYKFFEQITVLGSVSFYSIFVLFFLAIGDYVNSVKLIVGMALMYVVAIVIRLFYFKPRPEKLKYNSWIEKIDASSFPSIHSGRAVFLYAFFVILALGNLVNTLVFLLMLLIFCSRIYLKKHYWIDVIAGAVLGGIVGFLVL